MLDVSNFKFCLIFKLHMMNMNRERYQVSPQNIMNFLSVLRIRYIYLAPSVDVLTPGGSNNFDTSVSKGPLREVRRYGILKFLFQFRFLQRIISIQKSDLKSWSKISISNPDSESRSPIPIKNRGSKSRILKFKISIPNPHPKF